jgi:hypothetical protein
MTHRSAVPASLALESISRRAQFRDRIAIVVKAPPKAIFQAACVFGCSCKSCGARGSAFVALERLGLQD